MSAPLVLYTDDREAAVIPFLQSQAGESLRVARLERSDYSIGENEGKLFALFERKTLPDYGASVRDGRTKNKAKMLEVRAATGCHIYYIIEGPLRPSLETEFGGVKYGAILSSIRHLQTEHGIMIVRTANASETAAELTLLMESYAARPPVDAGTRVSYETPSDRPVAGSNEAAMLFLRAQKTQKEKRTELWQSLPGVGLQTAILLAADPPIRVLAGQSEVLGRLSAAQRAAVTALIAPTWNDTQKAFLCAMPGIGKSRCITIMRRGTSFDDLFSKRASLEAGLRSILEGALEY